MGALPTVGIAGQGDQAKEYYLNRKQAIFITAKSATPDATDITIEIIEKFDAYERGVAPNGLAAITQHLAEIAKTLLENRTETLTLRDEVKVLRDGYDQTQGVVDGYVPMLKVLEKEGVSDPRGRGLLSRLCSGLLRRWCAESGKPVRTCKITGRYLFHVDAAELWLTTRGKAIIRAHKDLIKGQGVLKLAPGKPRRTKRPTASSTPPKGALLNGKLPHDGPAT